MVCDTMTETSELGAYILELCDKNNMSMREASMESGLSPETIGVIVRRGKTTKPRPDTLRQIASGLGGSYEYMMQLAGHWPKPDNGVDPRLQDTANRLIEVWEVLLKLDPQAAENLLRIAVMQAEMVKAAVQANAKRHESENTESTS